MATVEKNPTFVRPAFLFIYILSWVNDLVAPNGTVEKETDVTFYFVWKKKMVLLVKGRFLVFLAAARWKALQTNMKECVALSLSQSFPMFFYLYFHERTWWRSWHWADFLALVQMRSGVMWRKKNLSWRGGGCRMERVLCVLPPHLQFSCWLNEFPMPCLCFWLSHPMS